MSQLRQPCPTCGRTLELPTSAVGRLAKCPACDATFTVTGPAPIVDAGARPDENPRASAPGYPPSPTGAMPTTSPYAPSFTPAPVVTVENIEIVQRAVEEIISPAWNIFVARWSPLVLSMLIVIVASIAVLAIPAVALIALAANDAGITLGLGIVALIPLLLIASTYAWIGLTRVAIAVARNAPEPLGHLYAPMHLVWRMILVSIVLWFATMAVLAVVGGGLGGIAFAVGGEELASIGVFFAFGILSIAGFAIQIVLWPLPFIISDDKSTAMGAIRISFAVAMQNKLTSFLLILLQMVLSMVGSSICYVGLLVTQPLTLLVFAVAYLMMTRQAIADPKAFYPPQDPVRYQ